MKKNRKGFTVIEIFIIVFIISILATVVLVNISSSRERSRNLSTFYSMRGTADNAFVCLFSQIPNSQLSAMDSGLNICVNPGNVSGYSAWPDISKSGWSNVLRTAAEFGSSEDGFYWCRVGYSGANSPGITDVGDSYDGSFGGSIASGNFCYMLKKGANYIWCTQEGCKKEGF